MKIAVLANTKRQSEVFTEKHIDELAGISELVINKSETGPEETLAAELITGADIAVTSWNCPALTDDILKKAPDLKLVLHAAGSIKGIVTPSLWDRGVRVSSAAAALGKGVAETALGLTIVSLKNVFNLSRLTSMGGWNSQNHTVRDIYDVKIGVIGGGHAGRHYIRLLKNFDVDIMLYDPTLSKEECLALGAEKAGLNTLLRLCDVVSLHAPSLPVTRHMINKNNLAIMKDGAVLINTARGNLINENDLIEELRKGRITACIDVTDPEPPVELNELRMMPNVVLTPHIAGAVTNGRKRIGSLALSEIKAFIESGTLEFEVLRCNLNKLA